MELHGQSGRVYQTEEAHRARGGESHVYRGVGEDAGIALKIATPAGAGALEREREELVRLHREHPGLAGSVVQALDWGIAPSGQPFLALPWYDDTLRGWILGGGGPRGLDERLLAAEMAAGAVAALRRTGRLVHRDIKPTNFLVRQGAKGLEVVLADFGGAKAAPAEPGGHTILYTEGYAPPEQALRLGLAPTAEADAYALAATVWWCLALERPRAATGSDAVRALTEAGLSLRDLTGRARGRGLDPDAWADLAALGRLSARDLIHVDQLDALLPADRARLAAQLAEDLPGRLALAEALAEDAADWLALCLDPDPEARASAAVVETLCRRLRRQLDRASAPTPVLVREEPPESPREIDPGDAWFALDVAQTGEAAPEPGDTVRIPDPEPARRSLRPAAVPLALIALLAVGGGGAWLQMQSRPVTLTVEGLPADVEAIALLDGTQMARSGATFSLGEVSVGAHPIRIVAGSGCEDARCPGPDCSPCCGVREEEIRLEPSMDPWNGAIEAPEPGGACGVSLEVTGLEAVEAVALRLDGEPPTSVEGGAFSFGPRAAGAAVVSYRGGAWCDEGCAAEGAGGDDEGACHHCCAAAEAPIEIPAEWGPAEISLALPAPPLACPTLELPFEMTFVAAGSFQMGHPDFEDATPQQVTLTRPFLLSATEVTQGLYEAVTGKNPSDCGSGCGASYPVNQVSWIDAVLFCNRLSELEGLEPAYATQGGEITWKAGADGYRLPSEAEWEFAARAGGDSRFAGTDEPDRLCEYANVRSANRFLAQFDCSDGYDEIAPVGVFLPNTWGLYDMTGGVREWVWDAWDALPGGSHEDPRGPAGGSARVNRGASWGHADLDKLDVRRRLSDPESTESRFLGFRIARSLPAPSVAEAGAP